MKKFTKICLIASLVLILIGGTICIISVVTGGWRLARDVGENNSWVRFAWGMPRHYRWGYWDWEELEDVEDVVEETLNETFGETDFRSEHGIMSETRREASHEQKQGQISKDYSYTNITAADVKNLQIEIGGASLYLAESENDYFGIKIEGKGDYKYFEKNKTFHLEGNLDEHWELINHLDDKVYLYLPKGMSFREAHIEVGGGFVEIDALTADEAELSVGGGQMIADKVVCRGLSVETGAGETILNHVTAEKLELANSAGRTYIYGDVSRSVDVECSIGQAELTLDGREQDFNYDIECAMGNITVGSRNYSSLADDIHINNGAAKECELECSMGEIMISFYEP